ncbi:MULTISPECIES: hypothetical protein [Psychrobacter]|uniref:Excisionase n=1 Tax=Psychrobacter raelei TaxID=2565531 RepID=A0AAU6PTF2_9GAMM|nr:hypothetical protein [Psychrobacter sp. H7-1]
MSGIYYTTAQIKEIFCWESNTTIYRKMESGFLPEPDLKGRPNKWLKSKIDDIISKQSVSADSEENEA